MNLQISQSTLETIKQYRLPRFQEIPNVGLYLNQVSRYINEFLAPICDSTITESMISNYVKMHIINSPVKKQYDREQMAYLLVIAISKSVVSLDNLSKLFVIQKQQYSCEVAYDYFCDEFENVLQYVFGLKDKMEWIGTETNEAKLLFRNIIITVAHKIYLEQSFCALDMLE